MDFEHFWEWSPERNLTTGAIKSHRLQLQDPERPDADSRDRRCEAHEQGQIESYDWPGRYLDLARGEDVEVGLRVDQERGQDRRHHATGNAMTVRAGTRVTLDGGMPVPGASGQNFVCLATTHAYQSNSFGSIRQLEASTGASYSATHVLMPASAPLAPRRKTELARIYGPQTARVVGEGEIDCDEYGRILVRFHWDLKDAYSMRCRVSQNWSGNGWGGMVIPRIGMEVVVEFLDGDPDQPLVTGCVYNGKNDCPYPLPEHKTRSTFRTDTHQGEGFNELRFEDQTGKEEIYVHAQKDMNVDVLDTHTTHVRNNKTELVENNRVVEVNRNHSEVIGGNMSVHVGPTHIGRFISNSIFRAVEQLGRFSKIFGLPGALNPGAGNLTVTVEKNALEAVGLTSVHTVGIDDTTFVGRHSKLNAGKEIKINAGDLVRITCGKTQIEMKENGQLTINGDKININALHPCEDQRRSRRHQLTMECEDNIPPWRANWRDDWEAGQWIGAEHVEDAYYRLTGELATYYGITLCDEPEAALVANYVARDVRSQGMNIDFSRGTSPESMSRSDHLDFLASYLNLHGLGLDAVSQRVRNVMVPYDADGPLDLIYDTFFNDEFSATKEEVVAEIRRLAGTYSVPTPLHRVTCRNRGSGRSDHHGARIRPSILRSCGSPHLPRGGDTARERPVVKGGAGGHKCNEALSEDQVRRPRVLAACSRIGRRARPARRRSRPDGAAIREAEDTGLRAASSKRSMCGTRTRPTIRRGGSFAVTGAASLSSSPCAARRAGPSFAQSVWSGKLRERPSSSR